MRKNLMRIASLALAFALMSVSAFALGGDYDASTGTFTVTGGETGLQTSLIIVKGAHDTLPVDVENEAVTDAVYIDQVAAASDGAEFGGVSIPTPVSVTDADVYTAFFSNESANSADSAKIVNASVSIHTDDIAITVGDTATIAVTRTASVTDSNTVAYVNDEVTALGGGTLGGTLADGLTFTPDKAGTYTIQLKATVEGKEVASEVIEITATALEVDPVPIEGDDTILDLVVSPTTEFTAQPVGIMVTFPDAGKTVDKMIWAFETADGDVRYSTPVTLSNATTVSGKTVFAAVVMNGTATDGVSNEDAITINKVGAIFSIGGQDFYTNTAYGEDKKTN